MKHLVICLIATFILTACQQAPPPVVQTSSKVGSIQKQYDGAIDAFRRVVAFDGGDVETRFRAAKQSYEQGKIKAESASHLIKRIDDSAKQVLAEWESELKNYSDQARQQDSKTRLDAARKDHEETIKELREAQAAMQPVLSQMNDLVLYLRHRLNEVALRGVPAAADKIDRDVAEYLESLNKAIDRADGFLKKLDQ